MQTLQPTLRLGRDVWDRAAMPHEEFHRRAARLRAGMTERGLDTLLLYGSNLNGCGHPTWLANYIVKLPFAALVVLPRDGAPALMFQGATRGRSAAQATTWIEDVRPCWNMAETCLAVLEERGLTKARIGLAAAPRLMPRDDWQRLAAGLGGATLVDAEDLVDRHRAIKTDREIAQVRRASAVVGHGLGAIGQTPPSSGEWQLAANVTREARMQGAEDIRLLIARPQETHWAFRPAEDAAFTEDDTVSVVLAASWERYWFEATRTFRVAAGRFEHVWSDEQEQRFRALAARLEAGTSTSDWCRAALDGMTPAEATAIMPYGLGHGIGITPEEWPALSAADPSTIESGMCFVVRAAFAGEGGLVLHGDTIVVE